MASPVKFGFIRVTCGAGATKVSSSPIRVHSFEMHVLAADTGPVFIGDLNVTTSALPRAKASSSGAKDGTYNFSAGDNSGLSYGEWFDLSKVYVLSGTPGDIVIIQYLIPEV